MTPELGHAVPGWYGKLPSLGDFASRRLPADFIRPWDAWLQEGLHATREAFGQRWLDCFLTAPIWRFVLLAGLVGPSGWAGVLMPSVDRVGRHFPLTLAVPVASLGLAAHVVFNGADWFAGMEEVTLAALDVTRGPDDLDAALADRALAPLPASDLDGAVGALRCPMPSVEAFPMLAGAAALRAWSQEGGWKTLWWTRGRVDDAPLMLRCMALPTAEEFAWLLGARASDAPGSGAAADVRSAPSR